MTDTDHRFPRYSRLLRLYPAGYRKEYGEQMLQTLADMLDDPARSHPGVWSRLVLDFPFSVIKQQLSYTGEVMATTMPDYMKRNAMLGTGLVAPFFLLLALHVVAGNRLEHSWFWHTHVLFIWLLVLPGLAIVCNLQALLRWGLHRRQETHTGTWKVLTDFRRNWPALGVIIIGLCILALVFGHDSVGCVTGNPMRELRNFHQTWQCVQQGVPSQHR